MINQLLFSIKAEAVADHTIELLKQGYKPIVAFASTMGAFVEDLGDVDDVVKSDFSGVLEKGLDSVLQLSVRNPDGKTAKQSIEVSTLPPLSQVEYYRILEKIDKVSVGISVSPIDIIIQKIEASGFSVGEVTGRKLALKYDKKGRTINTNVAQIMRRKKENTNDLFRHFNDNETDCLLINQSGSTGASAHAIVTDKVPENEVKKRVMVILQAELNINTEIQKRGRINRTGQVLKPRYDYLISSIPAEKRLMMMLKKKLKSLDANTTSNQKSSEDQLKSDDFLNKYGSKVVTEYLNENPLLNMKLGDPLNLGGDEEKTSNSDNKPLEYAAHKVSGRVAILPIKEQEQFYNDILERYQDYVDYLRQNDEYDLEVETLNLEAETKSKKVMKAGKGGSSAFSQDTYLEKCECNVLKKPFKQDELAKELAEVLNGRTGDDIRNDLIHAHDDFVAEHLKAELMAVETKYYNLTDNIYEEPKYKKLNSREEKREYAVVRGKELEDARIKSIGIKTREINSRKEYIHNVLMFFTPGRGMQVPSLGFDMGTENTKAICLGIMVDLKRKNPFAPSAVKVRIAVADSRRQLALPCSGDTGKELERIQARTYRLNSNEAKNILDKWDEYTSSFQTSRRIRYLLTGNLLQAAGANGKLVSYTTKGGDIKKGVLMPESWSPGTDKKETNADAYVIVAAKDASHYIKSLRTGSSITSENKIGIFRTPQGFKFIIPKGRGTQAVYKDGEVIALVENDHGFEQVSGSMTGTVSEQNITKVLELMGNRHGVSFKVGRQIFEDHIQPHRKGFQDSDKLTDHAKDLLKNDKEDFPGKIDKQNGKKVKINNKARKLKLLKLRAKAIIIKQKQAAQKAA